MEEIDPPTSSGELLETPYQQWVFWGAPTSNECCKEPLPSTGAVGSPYQQRGIAGDPHPVDQGLLL